MAEPGSGGNVIAALCSLIIPGLGQLLQGRVIRGIFLFVLGSVVWFVSFGLLGWIVHILACIDAAKFKK